MEIPIINDPHSKVLGNLNFETQEIALKFTGAIDESFGFRKLWEYLLGVKDHVKKVRINLLQVERISSKGSQGWRIFMRQVLSQFHCIYEQLSEATIQLAVIIPDLLSGTNRDNKTVPLEVLEFEVPYYCKKCEKRTTFLLKTEDYKGVVEFKAPPKICLICLSALDFDEFENNYSTFLQQIVAK